MYRVLTNNNMNTRTIKQRIREAILTSLEQLKTSHGVREVSRHHDLIATSSVLPALIYVDTGELEVARDATGQTYEFDYYIKVLVEQTKDHDARKDKLVAAVQSNLENLSTLTGLAMIKCGGEEKTAVTARFVFIEGPFVKFRLQYKRKRSEPEGTY
jgi:hypothetical protein